ncbi:MAG: hypothetical protein BGO98_35225 [Myxococcales bacterium 68-20]|mgnify:CR=1 FL=1|nr:MAG: hypothetical protein BGO98_35225 [Myxococcales bacterium 68-20]
MAYGAVVLAAVVPMACMASGDEEPSVPVRPDENATSVLDGEAPLPDADPGDEPDGSVEAAPCSEAGWCTTVLPDVDLVMKDIWVFPSRAVAVAESPTLGIKVLEWLDAEARWRYIDDGTQNDLGISAAEQFVGKIWMPNENEVYYGVSRARGFESIPGYIYHGTRTAQGTWSWARDLVGNGNAGNAGNPSIGVWGTSHDDVYAWFNDTIYRRTSADGAPPEWIAEYAAADPDFGTEKFFFFGAAGTSADDIWFAGARVRSGYGTCALLVRKTSNVYGRVADGSNAQLNRCTERAGAQLIGGAEGGLTDIHALGLGDLVALKGGRDVIRIKAEGEPYSTAIASVPMTVSPGALNSLAAVGGDLWLGGTGRVVRGGAVWDGGAFGLSTIWAGGTPMTQAIWQVKGTSNGNLWAIGVRNALHKTTL